MISSARSKYNPDHMFVTVDTSKIYLSQMCKSVGAIFDEHFKFRTQVDQICKSTYFSLNKISSSSNPVFNLF